MQTHVVFKVVTLGLKYLNFGAGIFASKVLLAS